MKKTFYFRLYGIVFSFLLICGFSIFSSAQGTIIKSSTPVVVNSGTTVTEMVLLTVESGAAVDNSGTIVLKGNLDNQNSSQINLGTGTFEFSGTSAQTITGQNLMNNVLVNNAAGLVIGGATQVNGILTLQSGRVTLGSNNLLLGPSATVAGTPTATNMVVATGTGQMQKQFTANGSFVFPVGDATGTAEYSPVTLNFTSGTYGSGAYAGVNLVNAAWAGLTTPFLNRYWNVSQNNITAFNCNAQLTYVPADVTGTEANIYAIRVSPNLATYSVTNTGTHTLTANGLTSFGTLTGGLGAMQAGLTAFLQGPYNGTNHNMNTTLTTLPLGDRSDNTKFPTNQPYNGAPWNYAGSESVVALPANTVDWVLVELRHAAAPASATSSTVIGRKAGFLLNSGAIVDLDGTPLKFTNLAPFADNLYPVIYHRNHMPMMAGNTVTRDANQVYVYDYSSAATQVYGGANGCNQVDASPVRWGMVSGDPSNDGNIYLSDLNVYWVPAFGQTNMYLPGDFNMDLNVYLSDNNSQWVPNFGKTNVLP